MKKIKLILLTFISLLIFPNLVRASSGTIKVTGSSTVLVGNKVTVTVTLSSASAIGSWQMDLNYDKSYLQLVSTNSEAGGTKMAGVTPSLSGVKTKTYTYTFKTLKNGSTHVSVSSYYIVALDETEMSITTSSKTIKIMTQQEIESTYSKDNNLKSLSVEGYELDKEFNKDTLEYKVNVPTGTEKINIKAQVNDSKASVSGTGEVEVTEGLNTLAIVVTAQNGDQKTYTLLVNVEDTNPIEVTVDNKNYTVVKNAKLLTAPETFQETTIKIDGLDIPAFINNEAKITLVGLKDDQGKINLFQYDNSNYTIFNKLNLNTYALIPTDFETELNLIKTTTTIEGIEYPAYKYSADSAYVIISAKSLIDGKINLYLYDTVNKTASLYEDTFINSTKDTINNYSYVIIVFGALLIIMLLVIFSLISSLRKKQKKIDKFLQKQEAKIEATRKLNDVIDEVKKITENENYEKKETKTKNKKDDVKVTKIEPNEVKEKKEEPQETKKEEPKAETKEINKDEEVYDLFGEDKPKKKKK